MQEDNGSMRMLKTEELGFMNPNKVIHEEECFKIKKCYFKVQSINESGFSAQGISREDYYSWKRR